MNNGVGIGYVGGEGYVFLMMESLFPPCVVLPTLCVLSAISQSNVVLVSFLSFCVAVHLTLTKPCSLSVVLGRDCDYC